LSTAVISSLSPSGSLNPITGREKRVNGPSTSMPRSASRTTQPSRDFPGTAKVTASTMPLPLRPRPADTNGKNVRIVPGCPDVSP
jgi:hypothetical protein